MRADKDPLLVSWRYGLGQVMAFTSDLSGRWGRDWVSWPGFPQWASQLARDTMRKILETRMRTDFHAEGETIKVVTDVLSRDGRFLNHLKVKANITAPDQASQERAFQQSAPGSLRGESLHRLGAAFILYRSMPKAMPAKRPCRWRRFLTSLPIRKSIASSNPISLCSAGSPKKPAVKCSIRKDSTKASNVSILRRRKRAAGTGNLVATRRRSAVSISRRLGVAPVARPQDRAAAGCLQLIK